MKRNIFLIMLLFKVLFLNAQSNDSVNTNSNLNKTNLQLSFRYFNKTVLSGRNYMIDGCMYNPAISFNLKSGLSAKVSTYVFTGDNSTFSEFSVGYNKDLFNWWNIATAYTYYYMSNATTDIQNELNNGILLENDFDFNWIFSQNFVNYFFGTQKDFDIVSLLGKNISLDDLTGVDNLTISPTISAEIGNHTEKFIQLNTITQTPTNFNKFQPLDYEIAMPFVYSLKGLKLKLTPSYAFPVNAMPEESTLSSHFFYFTVKITYQFDFTELPEAGTV